MQRSLHSDWPLACPECETEIDQATGICPACSWDRSWAAAQPAPEPPMEGSFSERYYGSQFAAMPANLETGESGMARGRLFLIVGTVAVVLLAIALSGSMSFL